MQGSGQEEGGRTDVRGEGPEVLEEGAPRGGCWC